MWLHHPHNTICRDLGFLKNLKTQGAGFTPKPDPPWMDVTSDTHPSIHPSIVHRSDAATGDDSGGRENMAVAEIRWSSSSMSEQFATVLFSGDESAPTMHRWLQFAWTKTL